MEKWQEEWIQEIMTKTLINYVVPWVERKHGDVDYYLTYFSSGHWLFKTYLYKMKLHNNEECSYCGFRDTIEPTILKCRR